GDEPAKDEKKVRKNRKKFKTQDYSFSVAARAERGFDGLVRAGAGFCGVVFPKYLSRAGICHRKAYRAAAVLSGGDLPVPASCGPDSVSDLSVYRNRAERGGRAPALRLVFLRGTCGLDPFISI